MRKLKGLAVETVCQRGLGGWAELASRRLDALALVGGELKALLKAPQQLQDGSAEEED